MEIIRIERPVGLRVDTTRKDRVPVVDDTLDDRSSSNENVGNGRWETALSRVEAGVATYQHKQLLRIGAHSRVHVTWSSVKVGRSSHEDDPGEIHQSSFISSDHGFKSRIVLLSSQSVDSSVVGP